MVSAGRHSVCCLSVGPHGQGERRQTSCQSLGPGPLSGGLQPSAWYSLCTQHLRGCYRSGFPEPPSSVIAKPVPDGGKSGLPFITPPPLPTWGLCVASPGDQVLT